VEAVLRRTLRERWVPETAAFLVAGLGTGLLAADQGGFYPRTWPWAALAFGAVAALTLLATPGLRIPRSGIVLVGGLGLLCAWTAISAQWSLEPSSSLREAERTLVYVAAALALVLLAAAVGATPLLLGLATAAVATACYSLVERAVRGPHLVDQQASLLERPLGYANALGALCAIGLVVVLTLAVRARSHAGRLILLGTAGPLALALALTGSRGSVVAAVAGLVVAAALLAGGRRWAAVGAALVAAMLVVAGVVAAVATPDVLQARGDYWHVAWHVARTHPALGTGAGTYDATWAAYGDLTRWGGALDAHSLYLESLAELGPFGLVLVITLLAPVVAVLATGRRSPVLAASLGGAVTFLVHAGLDWDWEMPAVTLAGLVCLAALVGRRNASFATGRASTGVKRLSSDPNEELS
jgi:hypothetical protein